MSGEAKISLKQILDQTSPVPAPLETESESYKTRLRLLRRDVKHAPGGHWYIMRRGAIYFSRRKYLKLLLLYIEELNVHAAHAAFIWNQADAKVKGDGKVLLPFAATFFFTTGCDAAPKQAHHGYKRSSPFTVRLIKIKLKFWEGI